MNDQFPDSDSTDSREWAKAFMALINDQNDFAITEELMDRWFDGAIGAGRDSAMESVKCNGYD